MPALDTKVLRLRHRCSGCCVFDVRGQRLYYSGVENAGKSSRTAVMICQTVRVRAGQSEYQTDRRWTYP